MKSIGTLFRAIKLHVEHELLICVDLVKWIFLSSLFPTVLESRSGTRKHTHTLFCEAILSIWYLF